MGTLYEGIVVGVTSGIILSLFFGLWNYVRNKLQRNNQVRFLASTIAEYRELIFSAKDVEGPFPSAMPQPTGPNIKKAYFDYFVRRVDSIMRERSSQLSYEEVYSVLDIFRFHLIHPEYVLNDTGYERFFGRLETLDWLTLPKRGET